MTKQIVFLLDETGSMEMDRDETIQAVNSYMGDLNGQDAVLHMTFFNSMKVEKRYQGSPISEFVPLTRETYVPCGLTPLYDAIGKTINEVQGEALAVILTDGQENASHEYNFDAVKALIDHKKSEKWEFLFLAKGLDVLRDGVNLVGAMGASGVNDPLSAMRAAGHSTADYMAGKPQQTADAYTKKSSGTGG